MVHNEQIAPIRVMVANISGVSLQLVVQLIQQEQDMLLVGATQDLLELLTLLDDQVDVLILGVADLSAPPGICSHLLEQFPHLRVLALMTPADRGMAYWLGLHQQPLQTISSTTLLAHIRYVYTINQTF